MKTSQSTYVVETEGLTKRFGDKVVVDGVDLPSPGWRLSSASGSGGPSSATPEVSTGWPYPDEYGQPDFTPGDGSFTIPM
jgi:hypothetical protein